MSFTQAISDGFSRYVDFSGRSSRSAYWWWTLFVFLVLVVVYVVAIAIKAVAIVFIVDLAFILPGIAVGVRRLHDTGRTGWWYLIGFVPLIGGIWLLVLFCQPSQGSNQYGAGPDDSAPVPAGSAPTFVK